MSLCRLAHRLLTATVPLRRQAQLSSPDHFGPSQLGVPIVTDLSWSFFFGRRGLRQVVPTTDAVSPTPSPSQSLLHHTFETASLGCLKTQRARVSVLLRPGLCAAVYVCLSPERQRRPLNKKRALGGHD